MNNICVHRYLDNLTSSIKPPGFADFLRGTGALFLFCKKYDYKLYVDYLSHPIFKYFKYNDEIYIKNVSNKDETIELLCKKELSYFTIYEILEHLFSCKKDFNVLTNSFHIKDAEKFKECSYTQIYKYYPLPDDYKEFIKELLNPTLFLEYLYDKKVKKFNIVKKEAFGIIHLRFKDEIAEGYENFEDNDTEKKWLHNISCLSEQHIYNKIIIISNYSGFYDKVNKLNLLNVFTSNSISSHTGGFTDADTDFEEKLQETLIDLMFMKNSSLTYCMSYYKQSGFSELISKIYNVPYVNISNYTIL
jgi:hypothetical protein